MEKKLKLKRKYPLNITEEIYESHEIVCFKYKNENDYSCTLYNYSERGKDYFIKDIESIMVLNDQDNEIKIDKKSRISGFNPQEANTWIIKRKNPFDALVVEFVKNRPTMLISPLKD